MLDAATTLEGFMHHRKHFAAARVTAFIRYSTSTAQDARQIDALYFVPAHLPWWARGSRIRLMDVELAALSEVLGVAHALVSKAESPGD